jgi:hypothetical protein
MKIFQAFLSMILYAEASAAAALSSQNPQPKRLHACAFRSPEPCQCPKNTIFQNSTTKVTIGANAKDVAAILYSCKSFSYPALQVQLLIRMIE